MASGVRTELPIEFYNNPDNCRSLFSTKNDQLPKRSLQFPLELPLVYSDFIQSVEFKACELQRDYPDDIWNVKPPAEWSDLYEWFDAQDIHIMGPTFLIQVLRKVCEQNEKANTEMEMVIDETVIEWVNTHTQIIGHVLFNPYPLDFVEPDLLDGLKEREMAMFDRALRRHCYIYHSQMEAMVVKSSLQPPPHMQGFVPPPPPPALHHYHGPVSQSQVPLRINRDVPNQPPTHDGQALAGPGMAHQQRMEPTPPFHHHSLSADSDITIHPPQGTDTPNVRPRGYSVNDLRPKPDHVDEKVRRHSSNEPPVSNLPDTNSLERERQNTVKTSPPQPQLFRDPAILEQKLASLPTESQVEKQQSPTGFSQDPSPPRGIASHNSTFTSPDRRPIVQQQDVSPTWGQHGAVPPPILVSPETSRLPPQDARAYHPAKVHPSSPMDDVNRWQNHSLPRNPSKHSTNVPANVPFHHNGQSHPLPNKPLSNWIAPQSPIVSHGPNGRKTVTFNGRSPRENRDETGRCTMFVRDMHVSFFDSLEFKALLDQQGELSDMTHHIHAPYDQERGYAFIHFSTTEAATRAIAFFSQYTARDGTQFYVNFATPKGSHHRRGYSSGSDGSNHRIHNNQHGSMGRQSHQSVPPSLQNQPPVYRKHQYSNYQSRNHGPGPQEPLTAGFQQQLIAATMSMERQQPSRHARGSLTSTSMNPVYSTPRGQNFNRKENTPLREYPPEINSESSKEPPSSQPGTKNGHKNKKKGGKRSAAASGITSPNQTPTKNAFVPEISGEGDSTPRPLRVITVQTEKITEHGTHHDEQKKDTSKSSVPEPQQTESVVSESPTSSNPSMTPMTASFTSTDQSRAMSVASMTSFGSSFESQTLKQTEPESPHISSVDNQLVHAVENTPITADADKQSTISKSTAKKQNKKNKKHAKSQNIDLGVAHSSTPSPAVVATTQPPVAASTTSELRGRRHQRSKSSRSKSSQSKSPVPNKGETLFNLKDDAEFPSLSPLSTVVQPVKRSKSPRSTASSSGRGSPVLSPRGNTPKQLPQSQVITVAPTSINNALKQ